jgi:hypothetical protein
VCSRKRSWQDEVPYSAGVLLRLIIENEEGGYMFFRNTGLSLYEKKTVLSAHSFASQKAYKI